tara:strand:+ start:932 stop:1174 length:243 start_codon:yes stop_codon:yes gene_type:complete
VVKRQTPWQAPVAQFAYGVVARRRRVVQQLRERVLLNDGPLNNGLRLLDDGPRGLDEDKWPHDDGPQLLDDDGPRGLGRG